MAVQMDTTQRASIRAAIAQVHDRFGDIGVLVNNAARTVARPFFEITEEEWDEVIAVNLRGTVLTAQEVIPDMIRAKWGRVVNLSSLAGQRGGPQVQGIHYASSKAGIIGATRYLANEFADAGITVNCIAPGPILTEATAKAPPDKLAMVAGSIPVGRIGDAAEVGALARYIVSEDAGFVTGMTFDINGGLLMR
ncbi:SDR family NAD(P)-dependent oxidoreductase [Tropicimonas sp. IMCC34011]|uniref:SDR family NAD(P)-dependent oxidoreductase n=1 Tax=Tropicimonas sp. IMCC34011 TaxID=2248759 RepID=UPI000E2575CD|nr:SDR family oxidoreductase [Tropicimonas sp. IMCC34011]